MSSRRSIGLDMARVGDFAPHELREADVVIVGCGTTGSWVAHDLLRLGFSNVRICDFDKVESHNIPAQFHSADHQGKTKVEAFKATMRRLKLPRPAVVADVMFPPPQTMTRWKPLTDKSYVWSCVDSVEGRQIIADAAYEANVARLIDLRMGPESGTLIMTSQDGPLPWSHYIDSLEVEFAPEPACGRRAYVTTAKVLTGLAVHHWIGAEGSRIVAARPAIEGIAAPPVVRMRPRVRIDLKGMMIIEER